MPNITAIETCECGCGAATALRKSPKHGQSEYLRFAPGHGQRRYPIGAVCKVDGCGRDIEAKWLCHGHFEMNRRGAPLIAFLEGDMARFMAKVTKLKSGHWIWTGALASEGRYGMATVEKRVRPAHVVAWLLFRGPIPEGFDVDHRCRKTLCVNPAHLEPKTHMENILMGDSPPAANAAKTHCIRGHAFTEENTNLSAAGGRICIACRTSDEGRLKQRDATRRYRARQKEALAQTH